MNIHNFKISFFVLLLISSMIFPSFQSAYAEVPNSIGPGEIVLVSDEQTVNGQLNIASGGELIIQGTGDLRVNGLLINQGKITIDGSYLQNGNILNVGEIIWRCGSVEHNGVIQGTSAIQTIPCTDGSEIIEENNFFIADDGTPFVVNANKILILTGETTIEGEIDNKGTIQSYSKITLGEHGLIKNTGTFTNFCSNFGFTGVFGNGEIQNFGVVNEEECTAPIAIDDNFYITDEDIILNVDGILIQDVLENDSNSDTPFSKLTASAPTQTNEDGTIMMNSDGTFQYEPKKDFFGTDSFTYKIEDSVGGSDQATVTIEVTSINDSPVAVNDPETGNISVNEDTSVTISVLNNDSDPDGDSLIVDSVINGAIGITTHDGTTVTYTPNPNLNGLDSFTYTISDGNSGTSTATVNINVVNQNDPPVISLNGPTFILLEVGDTYTEQSATCSDPDDGQIDDQVVIGGDMVDTAFADVYEVTYDCQDLNDENAEQITRTVSVETNDPPVITILGANPASVIVGETYLDAGAEAEDTEDGNLTTSITENNNVDTSLVGEYQVTYSVTDSDGNTDVEIRTVNVNEIPEDNLRDQTIEQIMNLEALIDEATDKKTKDEINKALKDLNKSVEIEKWEDNGNYLIDNKGKKVFDEQQKGVKHIVKILDKDKESDEFLSKVTSISLALIDIDEELSGNEFTIAEESPDSEQKCLDKAEKELEKTEKEEQKGKYDKAIDHLGHLWEKSVKCQ